MRRCVLLKALKTKSGKALFKKIDRSIYIKLIIWISISLIISCLVAFLLIKILKPIGIINTMHVNYETDRNASEKEILVFIRELYESKENEEQYITKNITDFKGNVYVIDTYGNVIYKNNSNSDFIEKISINKFKEKMKENSREKYDAIYPLLINDKVFYIIQSKTLKAEITYTTELVYIISITIAFVLFVILIFLGVRKKIIYIQYICGALDKLSKGDLKYEVEIKGEDELAQVAKEINIMEKALLEKIEGERNIEKQKSELITNISHDLKTPLTIILGYLDILRIKQYKSDEERDKYIDITYEKATSLNKMVIKLFELVKLSDKENTLNKREVNINKLLKQVALDYAPLAEEKGITIDSICSKENINLNVDLDKICRVFNNLMDNAIKYSPKNGIVNIILEKDEIGARIIFKNKCTNLKEMDVRQLFNRFYRGDKARNSSIEGSGIGLSIVRNIVELHDSNIWAEIKDGDILFILRLRG